MGKIMKDGIQYGVGGIQKAESITYDNADSGMVATDVQGALDELNDDLTLKSKTYGTHGIIVYRIGRIRVLKVTEPTGMSHAQNTWTDYATLDNKDIPLGTVDASIINNAAGQQSATPLQLRITSNGVVQVYNFTLSTLQALGTVIYISKN